jgi:hypothetical protein
VETIEKKQITKIINDRIEFWSRPKPKNIEVSPKEIRIETEDVFKFCSRMVIEELKFLKKQMKVME